MLITPILTLVQVLRSRDRFYVRWMLTIFATIYGSTFNITGIGDGTRHWERVYDYYVDLSFLQFISNTGDILLLRSNVDLKGDLYIHVISYFTGGFLGQPGLFFVFVGFIYGYFFAGSMVKVFDVFPSFKKHFPFFILSIYFIAILNLQSMNTVRTWTGFWILFYAVISYYKSKKLKYLFLLFVPPLIHVGFFVMVLPAWLIVFIGLKKQFAIAIYALSFITSIITPQVVINQLSQLKIGQEKVESYSVIDKEVVNPFASGRWYLQYKKSGTLEWLVVAIAIIFILNGSYLKDMNLLENKLFSIGLLSKALSNISWFLYALSNRTDVIASLFILAAIIIYWQRKYLQGGSIKMGLFSRITLNTCALLISPVFFYYLSNFIEYLSIYVFVLPAIAWVDESVRITVREVLGYFL